MREHIPVVDSRTSYPSAPERPKELACASWCIVDHDGDPTHDTTRGYTCRGSETTLALPKARQVAYRQFEPSSVAVGLVQCVVEDESWEDRDTAGGCASIDISVGKEHATAITENEARMLIAMLTRLCDNLASA
jgi:hypothetical protein